MDTEYLKTFCVVAEHKNFRKAAELLQVTQPCVSRRIQSLEEELGVALFERTTRAMVLTPQGKEFLPYAERTLGVIMEGTKKMKEKSNEKNLVIAGTATTSFNLLPKVIKEFCSHYDSRLTVYTTPSPQVFDLVMDQTIDLGIVTTKFNHPDLEQEMILDEEIVCVGQPNFVQQYFQGANLMNTPVPVINNDPATPPGDVIDEFIKQNPSLEVAVQAQYIQTAEQLALLGLGLAFLPVSAAQAGLDSGELIRVSLPGLTLRSRPVYAISLKRTAAKPSIEQFKEVIRRLTS